MLFNAFVEAEVAGRGAMSHAIAAYARVSDAATVASFFRTVMQKLIKVTLFDNQEGPWLFVWERCFDSVFMKGEGE